MERVWQWLRRPGVILTLGWGVLFLYAFPGVMTMDSFDQLKEGRAWFFTDSHPPAMAALFGIVDRIIAGPVGMLVIQSVAFTIGVYLLLRRALSPTRAAVWTVVIVLFPPVLAPLAVIWKDCLMAGFLVLGIAGIGEASRRARIAGVIALVVGTAMRYDAPAATLPLVVLLFEWQPASTSVPRYAVACAAWVGITAVAFTINALLVDREMHLWHSSLAIQDIAGTLANVDETIPDDELRPLLAPTGILVDHDYQAAARRQFSPFDFQPLLWGDGHLWNLPMSGTEPAPPEIRNAIAHAWREIVFAHPRAYASYRLSAFAYAIGVSHRKMTGMVVTHRAQYPGMLAYMGLGNGASRLQRKLEELTTRVSRNTKLFRPHAYAILALLLLPLAWRDRDVLALLLSGLVHELAFLPLVLTPDYRYAHWMIVCTCIALVMLIARRAQRPA